MEIDGKTQGHINDYLTNAEYSTDEELTELVHKQSPHVPLEVLYRLFKDNRPAFRVDTFSEVDYSQYNY